MIDEELRDLVSALRQAMQDVAPEPLPPLPPPATEEEMAAAEAGLGFPLPDEIRALYSIARGGRIGIFDISPIDQLVAFTQENLVSLERDMEWRPGRDPNHWDGEIPQGDLIVISWVPPTVTFHECTGPLAGRLVQFEFSGVDDVWGRLARSLADCFRWQLAAFELGAFEVRPFLDDDIIVTEASGIDRPQLIANLRPHLAAAGGTPAYFGIYDPPPGYHSP
jgi:hypothetical protein